jgi:hypothetical protein
LIAWSLRHYAWVLIACVLAGAAMPLILAPGAPTYEADALVVARQLSEKETVLPQLGQTVFDDGAVAAAVAADPVVGGDPSDLIPDRLDLVAAQDSVVLVVRARHGDPEIAARMADLAAAAFVDELNRPGAGVGQFAVQGDATVPAEPLSAWPPRTRAALGALAGCVLGVGLVALLTVVRRPVVSARDVEETAGVPLLGTVQLPRVARGGYAGPLGVRGVATVTRWLATVPPGRLLLISHPLSAAVRQRLFVMVGVALWTVRSMRFEAPESLVAAIRQRCAEHREAGRPVDDRADAADELVLVDGGSPFETVDPAVSSVSVVAVAPLGTPRRRLGALTSEYADGGLAGVVLVDVRPTAQRVAARRARAAASAPRPAAAVPAGVPEPERA